MIGTLINIITILLGTIIGIFFSNRISESIKNLITSGLGIFTLAYGISLFLKANNMLIPLLSVLLGIVLGELIGIESWILSISEKYSILKISDNKEPDLQSDPSSEEKKLSPINGAIAASLLFCVGPMAIIGSIQDGLTGDYSILGIKSIMDGFASIAFASSLGFSIALSVIPVFIYQGSITLLAEFGQKFLSEQIISDLSAVGGILLIGLAISTLLQIKKVNVANMLPAIFLSPIITTIFLKLLN